MDALARHLLTQAFDNAWADHRLLGACPQPPRVEFEATRTGFFRSIKATLKHNLMVDRHRLDALERSLAGQPPNPRAHLFQHEVHRRGQARAMRAGTRIAPPQLDDFFCAADAPLRVDDFRALGFSEAAIWPPE